MLQTLFLITSFSYSIELILILRILFISNTVTPLNDFFLYHFCTETVKWLQRAQIMYLSEVDVSDSQLSCSRVQEYSAIQDGSTFYNTSMHVSSLEKKNEKSINITISPHSGN